MSESETTDDEEEQYRLPRPNEHFPQFYSFWPDEDQDNLRELHYAVFGQNGPVFVL